jgi:hypothetical protein
MTSVRIRASQFVTLINTTPSSTATWSLLGDGVTSAKETFNPKITNETYIINQNATPSVDSYAGTMPVVMTAKVGDPVYNFIEGLKQAHSTMGDCETQIINVYEYEAGGPTAYPATKWNVAISIESFDREGGVRVPINFTINYQGDPTQGHWNANTSTFS